MAGHSSDSKPGLTVYQGRAGDHNPLAMAGALSLGQAISRRLGISFHAVGHPDSPLGMAWEPELAAARPSLSELAEHLESIFARGLAPLLALSRCAASLATLPVVMRHRPDACVVWLDAHPDLNVPGTTTSGYLGGMALSAPAGLWDAGFGNGLPLKNIVLVGARDLDPAEQTLVKTSGLKLVPAGEACLTRLRDAVEGRPLYVHLDCDVLDPGIVPTDYRVPGGITLAELRGICEQLSRQELVGLEIAEFENAWREGGEPVSPGPLLDALEPLISKLGVAA